MRIILNEIYDTLDRLGYEPHWNRSDTGFSFNFNLELALCRVDEKSMVVTFMVPCLQRVSYCECFDDIIQQVNSRNHVGRLVDIDGTAVSAVSSFYAFDHDCVDSQTCFAVKELERLIEEFFNLLNKRLD